MNIFRIILSLIALSLIIFNFMKIDFETPFKGDSIIAIIAIVASFCVIVMMCILRKSKLIEQKIRECREKKN